MTIAVVDTQHGATIALSTDSLAFRPTDIGGATRTVGDVETTYHATATNATCVPSDIASLEEITITYQNSPGLASPSLRTVQTLTITGPLPSGASTAEIMSITGYVKKVDDSPQYQTATGGSGSVQMKTLVFKPDGTTFTHTPAA